MAKCKLLRLKHSEIDYLLDLAITNKDNGIYWGRLDYFNARQDKVIGKLKAAANTKAPE